METVEQNEKSVPFILQKGMPLARLIPLCGFVVPRAPDADAISQL